MINLNFPTLGVIHNLHMHQVVNVLVQLIGG